MSKKIAWLLIITLLFSLSFVGCSKNEEKASTNNQSNVENSGANTKTDNGSQQQSSDAKKIASEQVFRYNITGEPTILDPAHYRDSMTGNIIYAIYEPLLRVSPNDKGWEPGLAKDFKVSEDNLVYTFTLRKDAKWEDGTSITAKDVECSYRRIVDPATASRKAFDFYFIKNGEAVNKGEMAVEEYGVKSINDYTVEITLEKPLDYFINLITQPSFGVVHKATTEEHGEYYGTETEKTMASGPFKVQEWAHDSKVILVKNENYWDAENVSLENIEISMATDSNTIVGLYKTDQLDYMDVQTDYLKEFKNTPEFNRQSNTSVKFVEFNPNKEFLNNLKIRKALALTVDRKIFVEKVLANGDLPAYGLVPPEIRGKDNGEFREQNGDLIIDVGEDPSVVEEAKKLFEEGLAEIGKTKEDFAQVEMLCIDSANHKRLAQAIQQMWKKNLEVEVKLVPLQIKMLIPILESGDFQILIGGGRKAPINDPADFIDFIYNEGKWDNEEYKELIEKSRETVGNERMDYLMKAEKAVMEYAIFIPQNFQTANYVVRKGVEGLRRYPVGVTFDWKYIKIYEVK